MATGSGMNLSSCNNEILFIMLQGNPLIIPSDSPGGLSPPLGHPPVAMVLYYLYTIAKKSPEQVMQRHRTTPPPFTGQGWRKGRACLTKKSVRVL